MSSAIILDHYCNKFLPNIVGLSFYTTGFQHPLSLLAATAGMKILKLAACIKITIPWLCAITRIKQSYSCYCKFCGASLMLSDFAGGKEREETSKDTVARSEEL